MKIKNTHELRLRANSHARHDHVAQGTYGEASLNGHVVYKGCAIACLSTPHRQADLRSFLADWWDQACDRLNVDDGWMREQLAREFGITERLVLVAEGLFEAQPTHGAAINFVRDFAHALPEGADIKPATVSGWVERTLDIEGEWFDWDDITERAREDGRRPVTVTKDFLAFLRSQEKVAA